VCKAAQKFPAAKLAFGAGDLDAPLQGLGITVLGENNFVKGGSESLKGNGGKIVVEERAWWFFVRAKCGPEEASAGLGNSRYLARLGYDLLCGLIRDPATNIGLGQKGLFDFEIGHGRNEEGKDTVLWIVRVRGRVEYEW
jgi:hypothetical protein